MEDPKQTRINTLEAEIERLRSEGIALCREIVAPYTAMNGTLNKMVDIIPKD
jgi:hypothetical protein